MKNEEYKARLAEDCERLRAVLGNEFPFGRVAEGMFDPSPWDCALDLAVDRAPVAERVQILRDAKAGGYIRPWNRDRGPEGL